MTSREVMIIVGEDEKGRWDEDEEGEWDEER